MLHTMAAVVNCTMRGSDCRTKNVCRIVRTERPAEEQPAGQEYEYGEVHIRLPL